MRRRVDLLRALAHRPRLLLMDEPSSGLDERSFRGLWSALDQLRKREGVSVLVATHRPEEAARCDRLVILAEGDVVARGTPAELVAGLQADLLVLEVASLDGVAAVEARLKEDFSLDVRVEGKRLEVPCEEGPRLLVRVMETMGQGTFESVSVRRPGLADVFFELSGARLDEEVVVAVPGKRRGRGRGRAA
jgi:ABC-2 type transport system ATP-binding protein